MHQFFVEPHQIDMVSKRVTIVGTDVNHIKNVLRMKIGEELNVSNGVDDKEYRCAIAEITQDSIVCDLYFVKEDQIELPAEIWLFQGLPKADKMEWIIQKTVELGVSHIVPVATKRCIVKLDDKKASTKLARWQEIAKAAAKQSKRGLIPTVHPVMSFSSAVTSVASMEVRLIPYELAEDMQHTRELLAGVMPGHRVAVFIGPEGGFDETEIQTAIAAGVEPITLGKRILRTETAGMTVLAWLGYLLEQ